MTRTSIAVALLATVAQYGALSALAHDVAHADGTRISMAPFQSRQAWQTNWDKLNQRGKDAGAQWECHGDNECNLYFLAKPGVKAHLATERYGRGYCFIVDGAPTADCYREDGKKSVWTLDKPFEYGLAQPAAPEYDPPTNSAPVYVPPTPAPAVTQTPAPVAPVPSSTGSPFAAPVAPAGMSYDYEIKGESLIIHAKGVISYDEAKVFNAFHETWKDKSVAGVKYTVLSLNSPGGNIWGAKVMADWVKKYNVSTIVANDATCASACVLVWGAGTYKAAGVTSHIGVHNASVSDPSFSAADKHAAEAEGSMNVIKTLAAEGAPAAVIAAAAVTENDDVHWLKTADIKGWNVTIVDKDGKVIDDTPAPAPQPQTAAANQSGLLQ